MFVLVVDFVLRCTLVCQAGCSSEQQVQSTLCSQMSSSANRVVRKVGACWCRSPQAAGSRGAIGSLGKESREAHLTTVWGPEHSSKRME